MSDKVEESSRKNVENVSKPSPTLEKKDDAKPKAQNSNEAEFKSSSNETNQKFHSESNDQIHDKSANNSFNQLKPNHSDSKTSLNHQNVQQTTLKNHSKNDNEFESNSNHNVNRPEIKNSPIIIGKTLQSDYEWSEEQFEHSSGLNTNQKGVIPVAGGGSSRPPIFRLEDLSENEANKSKQNQNYKRNITKQPFYLNMLQKPTVIINKVDDPPPQPQKKIIYVSQNIQQTSKTVGTETDRRILSPSGIKTEKMLTSTATNTDFEKKVMKETKSTNTDLNAKKFLTIYRKPNYANEGFHTYYDSEADVMGLSCCMCCSNCWRNCNNSCRGCRNTISCPVYCWLFFIIPVFVLLAVAITLLATTKI